MVKVDTHYRISGSEFAQRNDSFGSTSWDLWSGNPDDLGGWEYLGSQTDEPTWGTPRTDTQEL